MTAKLVFAIPTSFSSKARPVLLHFLHCRLLFTVYLLPVGYGEESRLRFARDLIGEPCVCYAHVVVVQGAPDVVQPTDLHHIRRPAGGGGDRIPEACGEDAPYVRGWRSKGRNETLVCDGAKLAYVPPISALPTLLTVFLEPPTTTDVESTGSPLEDGSTAATVLSLPPAANPRCPSTVFERPDADIAWLALTRLLVPATATLCSPEALLEIPPTTTDPSPVALLSMPGEWRENEIASGGR